MKKIFYIAKNELYSLFYSPIAWILMILFLVLTAGDYIDVLDYFTGLAASGGPNMGALENLTGTLTTHEFLGILPGVVRNLYIYFPLITMGLISREKSSGTIRLLYSSPIKISEIVFGKFLAIIYFTFCLVALLFLVLIALLLSIVQPDIVQMMASLLGLFLVLCTYAAIGLFISSLTTYQIVAAIITLGIFGLLSNIGKLWQDIDMIRDITYYMNIGGKAFNLINGLLNLRDVAYFLILIISFLAFTIIRIKSATESISWPRKAIRYGVVIVVAFVVGCLTNNPRVNVYVDATRNKVFTITPPTQAVLQKLNDGELEITAYVNLLDISYFNIHPEAQNQINTSVWEPYIRFKPDIKIKYIYYYNTDSNSYYFKSNAGKSMKEIAEKEAGSHKLPLSRFLSPDEVNRLVDTKAEGFRSFFVLRYKQKKAVVRTFDDPKFFPSENEVAAAINRMIAVPPVVDFVSDEIERGPFSQRPRDYKRLASELGYRKSLINQGYDFDTLSLQNQPIPAGLAALVIADPRTPIGADNLDKIGRYIASGGNLLVLTEPDRKAVTMPLLDKLGVSLHDGRLIQPNDKFSSDLVFTYMSDTAKNLSMQLARTVKDHFRLFNDSLFRVAMAGASAMEYQEKDGFRIDALLRTDKKLSWNRISPISDDSLQLKVTKRPGDESGSYITAIRMTRNINGKDQRIIIAGDADYLTGVQASGSSPRRYNDDFGASCFSYFTHNQFPANTLRPRSLDNNVTITVHNIAVQKLIFYWIFPGLLAIICSTLLIRRKRK